VLVAILAALALAGPLADSSQALSSADTVVLQLSPSLIPADSGSTIATATVTELGVPVNGDTVEVTVGGGPATAMTDTGSNGIYTLTIPSTGTPGQVTVTATDTTTLLLSAPSDQKTLTQYGSPASIDVQLSQNPIVANGSKSVATATVKDSAGDPVPLPVDTVIFSSSDTGDQIGPTNPVGDGTYTAQVTSSRQAGPATITATDTSPSTPLTGSSTLMQTPGPAAQMAVTVNPAKIPADGSSSSTATTTVTDANGNPVSGETVNFSSSDQNQTIGPTSGANGTYTARITASTSPGQATITATDASAGLSSGTVLTQTGTGTVTLVASPSSAVTNQPITLFAAVNPHGGSLAGTVTFYAADHAISGCSDKAVSNADPTATCPTTFTAATSPGGVTATFTPSGSSNVTAGTGATLLFVGRASTSAAVILPAPTVAAGAKVTYTAAVTPGWGGAAVPSGTVAFLDRGVAIAACADRPLVASGSSPYATCTASSSVSGTHGITAVYNGDQNFLASDAAAQQFSILGPRILGTMAATMQWSFFYAPKYSRVLDLRVSSAPVGATIHVGCQGGGCPFRDQATKIVRHTGCRSRSGHRCSTVSAGIVQLAPAFGKRHLRVGAQVSIAIVQPRWVGKYYGFTFRARRGPSVQVSCLAPGAIRPGKSC
jgi:adhesin/invasin